MAKVIIVEDDLKTANIYKERLAQEGYEAIVASDTEALSTIVKEKPDIVLLDILMPRVNGLTILREIKTQRDIEHTPILILTNIEDAREVMQAIELGASGYLVKADTSLDLLVQKVKQVLSSGALSIGVKS